ncbi:MAG: hypothetical protein AAF738_10485, partial [Bacteroidota bacterium]
MRFSPKHEGLLPIATLLLFVIVKTTVGHSQNTFQKTIESEGNVVLINSILSIDNATIAFAWITEEEDVSPSGLSMIKIDEQGQILWSKQYRYNYMSPFEEQSIIDKEGNIVLLMYVNIYDDPDDLLSSQRNAQLFAKFTPDGELIWDFIFDYTSNSLVSIPMHIVQDTGGDYILSTNQGVLKVNNNGQIVWYTALKYVETNFWKSAAVLSDNSIVMLGAVDRIATSERRHTIICKINSEGSIVWARAIPDIRPWHISSFQNSDILLSGYTLSDFEEVKFICISSDGQLVWNRHLPIRNDFIKQQTVVLENGDIVACLNKIDATALVKLSTEGEVIWARQYPKSQVINSLDFEWGNLLVERADGGLSFLNERWEIDKKDIITQVDRQGINYSCPNANICISTIDFVLDTMIDVEITSERLSNDLIRIDPINGVVYDVVTSIVDYCPKLPVPS